MVKALPKDVGELESRILLQSLKRGREAHPAPVPYLVNTGLLQLSRSPLAMRTPTQLADWGGRVLGWVSTVEGFLSPP